MYVYCAYPAISKIDVVVVINRIIGVNVRMLTSSAVDRGFEPRSVQTKDFKICICSFSVTHAALRRNSKDLLARHQNNVTEWGDMSTPQTVDSVS